MQQTQWLGFVEKIYGNEKEVTKSFTQAYDGIEVKIRDISLVLLESFVVEATRLLRMEEGRFQN